VNEQHAAGSLNAHGPPAGTHIGGVGVGVGVVGVGIGVVGKLGPLNPRRAASVSPPITTLAVTAPAPKPNIPFMSLRRLLPDASDRTNESNRVSSMPTRTMKRIAEMLLRFSEWRQDSRDGVGKRTARVEWLGRCLGSGGPARGLVAARQRL
jgi:hypothetical protein